MGYQIKETLLPVGTNRPGTKLNPVGIVIHETATPNATDEAEYSYFCGGNRNASAHYFVDYDSISRIIPENEVAWHAGATANKQFLSIELCHFDDSAKFQEIWNRGVWLVSDMCKRYGWNPNDVIHSHHWCTEQWHESDHTDPDEYFAAHGKTMDNFVTEVEQALATKPVFKINVNGVEEHYDTKDAAYKRGWDLLKAGYKDVYVIEPDGGLYTFGKHPEDNPYAYRLNVNGVVEVYYTEKEGYDRGWYLYNNGYKGVIMNDPDGIYTFDKHPEDNPQKVAPAPNVIGTTIKGNVAVVDGDAIDAYIRKNNPNAPAVGKAYVTIGTQLGIRGDVAVAQAIKETGWFKFGGDVTASQNNFCGLGTTGGGVAGASFATVEDGVMAHLQHLWAYTTNQPLPTGVAVIDPRFSLVQSLNKNAVYFEDLGGKWAVPGFDKDKYTSFDEAYKAGATYGQDIVKMYEAMKAAVGTNPAPTPAPQDDAVAKHTEKKDVFYTLVTVEDKQILGVVIDGKGYVRASDIADFFNRKALFDTQTGEIVIADIAPTGKSYDAPGNKQTINIDVSYTLAHIGNLDMEAVIIDGKGFLRVTVIAKAFGYTAKYDTVSQEMILVK